MWEETLTAASKDLPTKEEEETGGEVIPYEGKGDSPAHQSFRQALSAEHTPSDSDVLLPLTKEQRSIFVRYSYLFVHIHLIFNHFIFQIFTSSQPFSKFSLLMGLRKLREAAELKCYAACLEQEGIQELEMAMWSTPVSQLVDLMTAGVHDAGESAPPSPSVKG